MSRRAGGVRATAEQLCPLCDRVIRVGELMDTTAATPASELLTTDELAAYLKVPVPTVRMWRHNGTGPKGVRLGRHVRYRRSDVDRWIENNERAQRPRAD